jgi:hypothetical protein
MAEDKYRIDPNITTKIMDSKGINYGHAIGKMFEGLGDIQVKDEERALTQESLKLGIDNAKKEQILKGISVQGITDKIEDEKAVGGYIASDYTDWGTYAKDNGIKLKTPQMMQSIEKLSDERYVKLMDESLGGHEMYLKEQNRFYDKNGNIDMPEVRKQLSQDPNNIFLAQAFERKYGTKLEKPAVEVSAKDQVAMLKAQADINKSIKSVEKMDFEMKNPKTQEKKDPFEKEKLLYQMELKSGKLDSNVSFESWMSSTGGKLKIQNESISKPKDKLTVQFDGISKLTELIKDYDDTQAGILQGGGQAIQELTGIHSQQSAKLESQRNGITMALTKALAGGSASNTDRERVESIIGGAWQTESGTAGKYKSSLDQSIISVNETITQLENAGYDAKNERVKLKEYEDFRGSIDKWDGNVSLKEFLKSHQGNGGNKKVTRVIGQQPQTPQPQQEQKQVVKTGMHNGRKVVQYSDGSVAYAD